MWRKPEVFVSPYEFNPDENSAVVGKIHTSLKNSLGSAGRLRHNPSAVPSSGSSVMAAAKIFDFQYDPDPKATV